MDDLKGFKVPVLILSGGEPLLRPDIYDIAKRAKAKGFYVGLSSNGTLIDENNIDKIAECDFNYVGVSLDGIRETHDKFRRLDGAFEASLKGIRLCRDLGLKIGVRFTMTQDNAHDLPACSSWSRTKASTASTSRTSTTPAAATRTARTMPSTS
jgi:MoaA/NifB/PqqE/SkfB family radical SAM enzyme